MAHSLKFVVILLFGVCIKLQHATETKYEMFISGDKTKWIPVSQLEKIFGSIEDNLREINEKLKRDNSVISQLSSNVQSFNIRLQGIEEQLTRIERAESYSKAQLQQFSDGSIKEELQIDQISHRIEKNQQQLIQRLHDIDFSLETITKNQEIMEKDVHKINVAQSVLTSNVDELSQHTKQQSTKILQNLTNTQQEFHRKLKQDSISPSSNHEEKVQILTAVNPEKNSSYHLKSNQNDDTSSEWLASLLHVENKVGEIKTQVQSLEINLHECTDVANKIYNKLDSKKDDLDLSMKDQFSFLLEQMKQQNNRDLSELEVKFRKNFESIFNEQVNFKNTCHRLQLYEETMEDKAVEILEKLFNYIDNRTYEIQHEIENLVICSEKHSATNYSGLSNDLRLQIKMEERPARTLQNLTNVTKSDEAAFTTINTTFGSTKLNHSSVKNNSDCTNAQEKRTQVTPDWFADESPLRQSTAKVEKEKNAIQTPENFFGIDGLSRLRRSSTHP